MRYSLQGKRYLQSLLSYSNEVYEMAMSKVPCGKMILVTHENGEEEIDDNVANLVSDILLEDYCNHKISICEMAYISVFIGKKIFNTAKFIREDDIEEKIFEKLLRKSHDEKITFLLNYTR